MHRLKKNMINLHIPFFLFDLIKSPEPCCLTGLKRHQVDLGPTVYWRVRPSQCNGRRRRVVPCRCGGWRRRCISPGEQLCHWSVGRDVGRTRGETRRLDCLPLADDDRDEILGPTRRHTQLNLSNCDSKAVMAAVAAPLARHACEVLEPAQWGRPQRAAHSRERFGD